MKLLLKRIARKPNYTIGKLYIDNKYFCDIIEDTDRGLNDTMTVAEITKKKVYGKTAIPTGTYKVTLDVVSPKYSKSDFFIKNANGGRVPRLLNIKGFDGVLIHTGNTEQDSLGCLIVGQNKQVGKVLNSRETFVNLYKVLSTSKDPITITIE